jgi:NADH-quinone oxidoreductase subunit J
MLQRGMSGYLLAFEIISIHLVVVLVGAAYLARARRRVCGPTEDY